MIGVLVAIGVGIVALVGFFVCLYLAAKDTADLEKIEP